jgi:hypothetical protein
MREVCDESAGDFFSTSRTSHPVREVGQNAGSKKEKNDTLNCLLASSLERYINFQRFCITKQQRCR